MDLGLLFPGGGMNTREMLTIARRAEDAGLDALYCVEAWRSGFVPLTAIAMVTERVRLGPYILNAYGSSPFITGMSAIDFDEISGGRLVLCVGSGNQHINERYQGVPYARPLTKMAEYVELLRTIVRTELGKSVDYDGKVHSMHWAPAVAPTRPSIPVHLAASYPKMTRVAGRVADGVALGTLVSPAYIRDVVRPAALAGAEEAGRDPAGLRFLTCGFTVVDEDRDRARDVARSAICALFHPLPHPYYDYLLREQGFAEAADAASRYVPEGRVDAAKAAMSDELIDTLCVVGPADECRARVREFDGVVDELIFSNAGAVGSTLSLAGDTSGIVESYERLLTLV